MAKKKKNPILKPNNKIIQNLALIRNTVRSIYTDTYSNLPDDAESSETIKNDINDSIDQLMQSSYANNAISSMNKLYKQSAMNVYNNQTQLLRSINAFEDPLLSNSILTAWTNNRWITEQRHDINLVLKYMPKLREAMNCKKDLVLSADHFSKEFCSFHKYSSSKADGSLFSRRMDEIKRVYKLAENYELWYNNAQIYGDEFIFISPYKEEFVKLLKNKHNTRFTGFGECTLLEATVNLDSNELLLTEDASLNEDQKKTLSEAFQNSNIKGLKVRMNKTGMITSLLESYQTKDKVRDKYKKCSLNEAFNEMVSNKEVLNEAKFDKLIPDELEMDTSGYDDKEEQSISNDGLLNVEDKINIKTPGCVVKRLIPDNTIPIYIEDECMGYYYIEVRNNVGPYSSDPNVFDLTANGITEYGYTNRNRSLITNSPQEYMQKQGIETVLNYVTNQIANSIDEDFINNNQELRKQIYMVLKHNDMFNNQMAGEINANIDISFLSPDDVVHMKFDTDPVTHRGISDLAYALFPAKLYSCMYITQTIAFLTRGQDKRVYYIKQNVEQNISKTMMNVLVQLKKGNFNARSMEKIDNILNITGKYNDLLIPLSSNGEAPVQIENMPGQQFTDTEEFLTRLEKSAIDATDIPYDLIEARQSMDYAIQATMTNSKVMRNTFNRQDKVEGFYSIITSKIYNYEYEENERVDVTLPVPVFLNASNGSQLVSTTLDFINNIIETEYGNESDEFKAALRKRAFRFYMPTHLEIEKIDEMANQARLDVANEKPEMEESM